MARAAELWGTQPSTPADTLVKPQQPNRRFSAHRFTMHAPSRLERWLQLVRSGLFGVLFVMAKDVERANWAVMATLLLDFVQMLGFPLNHSTRFPWGHHDQTGMHTFVGWIAKFSTEKLDDSISDVRDPARASCCLNDFMRNVRLSGLGSCPC